MNFSKIVKQSAFDSAMCLIPNLMPRLLHCATVELESDMFGLITLGVKYYRVPADLESGAEATIEVHTVFLDEVDVTNMLTNDSMDEVIDEILGQI